MKIFVPRYRHDLPPSNSNVLNAMFVEIDERDLPRVIDFWKALDLLSETVGTSGKDFFRKNVTEVCEYPVQKRTLEPYLRRPHITIHCGAKDGTGEAATIAQHHMSDAGILTAECGFNLWYGGGNQGLMGATAKGFLDKLKENRFPDQYSIQIIPASFVYGVESRNGLRPANEGLCRDTDIAIIMPDFVTRRDLLSNNSSAAISGVGGVGTLDELTDILVHIKTGLRQTRSYILNPKIPELGRGYWGPLLKLIEGFMQTGFEGPTTLDHVHFKSTAQEIFTHLMEKLDADGQNPHHVYAEYCRAHKISPSQKTAPDVPRPDFG